MQKFSRFTPIKYSLLRDSLELMPTAYIGMGGNLASWAGSPGATLAAAALCLESLGRVVRRSSLYSTEPVGFTDQPRFVNAVIALETELEPRELLEALLAIEQEFGRSRTAGLANRPRTLDLDILLFGDLEISEPDLNIPHPRLAERAFVLIPLNEIAPQILIPGYGESVAQLMASLALKVKPGASELLEGSKTRREAVVRIESDAWGPR